ncbi:hypothetical protein SAY87_002210 [Trapa incisa]|uniref:Uncharacterized protein n=1 Tax=Trapa incisa TaxID=236973 RepID=A0AAN7JUG5_9MYRT|nr:hypothetical protein SAY87_002210 [Trapa incisa]
MNPLCCIAPIWIDRDRCQVGIDPVVRTVNSGSKHGNGAQVQSGEPTLISLWLLLMPMTPSVKAAGMAKFLVGPAAAGEEYCTSR